MRRDQRKFYRFALYGRSGSGKSCLLGALAVAGQSIGLNGQLFTCERLPYEGPERKDTASSKTESATAGEDASLYNGKLWMDEVCAKIETGEPIPPTAISWQPPPAVDFRVADPEVGEFFIRIVDYSGELINPDAEADPDSLTVKLKQRLAECDGLLILAEAPHSGKAGSLAKELRLLREAFHSLRQVSKNPLTTPVGILVSKWDRYSEIGFDNPQKEGEKLEQFLKENPEHFSLVHSVKVAFVGEIQDDQARHPAPLQVMDDGVTSAPEQTTHGHATFQQTAEVAPFQVVPVSAFGKAKVLEVNEARTEVAAVQPPRPFNALEPFAWLAKRRDDLELRIVGARWQKLRRWWWLPVWFIWPNVRRLARGVDRIARRMASNSPHRRTVAGLKQRFMVCTLLSILCSVAYLVTMGDGIVSAWHIREYLGAAQAVNNQGTSVETLAAFRAALENWIRRPYTGVFKVLLVPESSRKRTLEALNQRLDTLLYSRFEKAPGVAEKEAAAQDYLRYLPAGPHPTECREYVDKVAYEDRLRENNESFEKLKAEWPKNQLGEIVRKYKERVDTFQWPHSDAVTSELQSQLDLFRKEVDTWYAERMITELRQHVSELLEAGEISQAVQEVLSVSPGSRSRDWANVAKALAERIPDILQHKCSNLARLGKFEDALKVAKDVMQLLKDLEVASRASHSEAADGALRAQQRVASIRDKVSEEYDQTLYNMVRDQQSKPACESYLKQAPLRSMERWVRAYYDYLKSLDESLTLTIRVTILWDPKYIAYNSGEFLTAGQNFISVFVNDDKVLHVGPRDEKEERSDVGTFVIKAPSSGYACNIYITIVEYDPLYNDDGGQGSRKVSMEELRAGITIPLRGPGFENQAFLKIESGWPPEPELPPWTR